MTRTITRAPDAIRSELVQDLNQLTAGLTHSTRSIAREVAEGILEDELGPSEDGLEMLSYEVHDLIDDLNNSNINQRYVPLFPGMTPANTAPDSNLQQHQDKDSPEVKQARSSQYQDSESEYSKPPAYCNRVDLDDAGYVGECDMNGSMDDGASDEGVSTLGGEQKDEGFDDFMEIEPANPPNIDSPASVLAYQKYQDVFDTEESNEDMPYDPAAIVDTQSVPAATEIIPYVPTVDEHIQAVPPATVMHHATGPEEPAQELARLNYLHIEPGARTEASSNILLLRMSEVIRVRLDETWKHKYPLAKSYTQSLPTLEGDLDEEGRECWDKMDEALADPERGLEACDGMYLGQARVPGNPVTRGATWGWAFTKLYLECLKESMDEEFVVQLRKTVMFRRGLMPKNRGKGKR